MKHNFFIYGVRVDSSLANGSQVTKTINIANDSDFECVEIRTTGTDKVFITLKDSSGNNYNGISFNASLIAKGNDSLKLFDNKLNLPANTSFDVIILNSSGGSISANEFEVQLIGKKVQRRV